MPRARNQISAGIFLGLAWLLTGPSVALGEMPSGIAQNAHAPTHWAYVKPQRQTPPAVKHADWPQNPIDAFVLHRLERQGITPSPPAQPTRLIRRVYLDLIGLPPTVSQVDAFLKDRRPGAYERVVDCLLASPAYGEKWARQWLDLARYADSNGYQRDGFRDVWAYRDWVIEAFNTDMPFDRFTIEQLAGDLVPDATVEQRIATGFHRGTTVNVEAGVDQEVNRLNAVVDRVNTTGTVWLGTTIQCARCHDHKYDPFDQKDYYRLFAYFNNTEIETAFRGKNETAAVDFTGPRLELPEQPEKKAGREELQRQRAAINDKLRATIDETKSRQRDWERETVEDPQRLGRLPARLRTILSRSPQERTDVQTHQLADYFQGLQPGIRSLREKLSRINEQLRAAAAPTTLVMKETDQPRPTYVLRRGDFDDPRKAVVPGVPASLHRMPNDTPANRLGLAYWLVDSDNPLTARVVANRWWAEFFGHGLVASLEDFGTQGEAPTHPKLLDWLATELIECGWSRKAIHRLIVTSAVYRQSSRVSAELLQRDPYNKLYARGPRHRLDAETIRDNALAVSGLLCRKMGGPPIRPPQPQGVWRVTGLVDNTYRTSRGEDRYRRGIYAIWRRSAPYPSFVNFDAPDRASCVVQRARTNTPLQALTLMNDPVYVEAARELARRILTESRGLALRHRVTYAFRLCLARGPRPEEAEYLEGLYRDQLDRFEAATARALLQVPRGFDDTEIAQWAAWFYVANTLLNLDETITK